MISRIVVAIAYGIAAFIITYIIGAVCIALGVPVLTTLGDLLERFAPAIGVLVGVLAFFGRVSGPIL